MEDIITLKRLMDAFDKEWTHYLCRWRPWRSAPKRIVDDFIKRQLQDEHNRIRRQYQEALRRSREPS